MDITLLVCLSFMLPTSTIGTWLSQLSPIRSNNLSNITLHTWPHWLVTQGTQRVHGGGTHRVHGGVHKGGTHRVHGGVHTTQRVHTGYTMVHTWYTHGTQVKGLTVNIGCRREHRGTVKGYSTGKSKN